MKRIIMIALLAAILGGRICATAESVPSAELSDVKLEKIVTADGTDLPEGFLMDTIPEEERTEAVASLYRQIGDFLAEAQAISDFFKEEEIAAAASYLPVEFDPDTLVISEYFQLIVSGYQEEIGDVEVLFLVPGSWQDGDVVLAMVCLLGAEGEETVWIPLVAAVEEGHIKVTFPQDALARMEGRELAMVILRG